MSPMAARMRSFAMRCGGSLPWKTKRMVGGTFTHSLPVPMMKPASVLPMPVANSPNAPAVQVWLSVPKRTTPGRVWPSSGSAMWHTPLYWGGADVVKVLDVLLGREMTEHFDVAVGHL